MRDKRFIRLLTAALSERTEWDECPELYFVTDCHSELELLSFELNEIFWKLVDPPEVVSRLANGLLNYDTLPPDKPPAPPVPAGLAGVAFRFEAWGVVLDQADFGTEKAERLNRASAEHEIHLQPERIEQRQMLACSTSGELYWVRQNRGEGTVEAEDLDPQGRVPQALAEMVMALKTLAQTQQSG